MLAKPNEKLVQIALDKEVHKQLKIRCIELNRTMAEQIQNLIKAWLAKQ